MAKRGALPGNDNAKSKPWAGALRAELANYEDPNLKIKAGQAIRKIARSVVEKAMAGDKDAVQEIGNRLDGKPHQTIAAEVDTNVTVEVVRFGKGKA